MDIRPLHVDDLRDLADVDATIEATQYLHVEKGGAGSALSLSVEERPLRSKQVTSNPIDDELRLALKQVASGADEGIALVAEHEGRVVAVAIAQPDPARGTMRLLDVRVDYDFRRQGIGTAMVYQIIQRTRDAELRAVAAETLTNNHPASRFLMRTGFELAGVDTRRRSNHDVVKEAATLFWYASLD
jgi:ribosomal protein S18 acetylase RimI-like enzyme